MDKSDSPFDRAGKYTTTLFTGSMNINFNYANVRSVFWLWLRLWGPSPTQIRDIQSNWLRAHYNCISIRQKCQLLLPSSSIMSGVEALVIPQRKKKLKNQNENENKIINERQREIFNFPVALWKSSCKWWWMRPGCDPNKFVNLSFA